jgi:hypothetical protein
VATKTRIVLAKYPIILSAMMHSRWLQIWWSHTPKEAWRRNNVYSTIAYPERGESVKMHLELWVQNFECFIRQFVLSQRTQLLRRPRSFAASQFPVEEMPFDLRSRWISRSPKRPRGNYWRWLETKHSPFWSFYIFPFN